MVEKDIVVQSGGGKRKAGDAIEDSKGDKIREYQDALMMFKSRTEASEEKYDKVPASTHASEEFGKVWQGSKDTPDEVCSKLIEKTTVQEAKTLIKDLSVIKSNKWELKVFPLANASSRIFLTKFENLSEPRSSEAHEHH